MPQSLSKTIVHITFSTKNRVKYIDDDIESALFGYIGTACNNMKCYTINVGGYRDHIHVLCSLNREVTQSQLVREIKTSSSKWIKTQGEQFKDFYWQRGYAIFSVSQSQIDKVFKYIENQKEHHQVKTFNEEYIELLKSHEIAYEEQYM